MSDEDRVEPNDVIVEGRVIIIEGPLDGVFSSFSAAMYKLEEEADDPIKIEILSEGGEYEQGISIVNRMKISTCDITTIGYGSVQSGACLILAAGTYRMVFEDCTFMWHTIQLSEIEGNYKDVEGELIRTETANEAFCKNMAKFSTTRKATKEFWLKLGEKDTYLSAKELKKLGVIDKICYY